MKIKEIKYERLESDPYGYNNTRICMVAEIEDSDDPIQSLNILKNKVDERHRAYREVKEKRDRIKHISFQLNHSYNKITQLKLDEDSDEIRKEIQDSIDLAEKELKDLESDIDELIGTD